LGGILWQPLMVQAICPVSGRRADVDFLLAAERVKAENIPGGSAAAVAAAP